MNAKQVMRDLKAMGTVQTRKIYKNHGAPDNFFGVKVGDMKKIVKKVKKDQVLAEELFATGNADAQYLAGLIADPQTVTKKVLRSWASLLTHVKQNIHKSHNRVRYKMNGFVISVGCYVTSLSEQARKVAEAIGKVEVDVGNTSCKVPSAPEYIDKVVKMGRLGKKRKSARC
jgi:hypothetical protein